MRVWEFVSVAGMVGVVALAVQLLRTTPTVAADVRLRLRKPVTWVVGVPALLLIITVGIPYVDAHVLNGPPPKPLSFADLIPASPTTTAAASGAAAPAGGATATSAAATATSGAPTTAVVPAGRVASVTPGGSAAPPPAAVPSDSVAGTWSVGTGSEARYGIDDTAMGQTSRVVGRTQDVSGSTHIVGSTVETAKVVVNMQTVSCHCVHDGKYRQMLETSKYPTSTFDLTRPIVLATIPAPNQVVTVPVTGNFTIHGVTHSTTFSMKATRIGPRIAVMATIPVNLSDYNIQSPNAGSLGGLSNCTIDLLIAFDRTGAS